MDTDLVKLALSPQSLAAMSTALKGFGGGAGVGGLVGAGAGALVGAGKGYSEARRNGSGVGGAIGAGLGGAFHGGGKGALLGALGGGAVGAVRPELLGSLTKSGPLRSASNFGQRQVHALTGVGDASYARSIGAGAADAEHRLRGAREAWNASIGTPAQAGARKELAAARQHFSTASENEAKGLSSIPGYLKSMAKDPVGTIRAGAKEQWQSSTPGARAALYGLPTAFAAADLLHAKDPSGKGEGRFERAGRTLGYGVTGMAAPLPILGDAVAGSLLSKGLGRVGRGIDKLTHGRRPPAAPSPEPAGGSTQASEHVVSDRAAGVIPESLT